MVCRILRWTRSTLVATSTAGMLCVPVMAQQPVNGPANAIPTVPARVSSKPNHAKTANTVDAKSPRLGTAASLALDVTLDNSGTVRGEIRDAQGQIKPGTPVALWRGQHVVQRVQADGRGAFQFAGLKGGMYRIATPDTTMHCRFWTAGHAPPASRQGLLIVTNEYSERGQQPINEVFCFNPFLMGTIIAAAIAIPIAVHESGDDELSDGS